MRRLACLLVLASGLVLPGTPIAPARAAEPRMADGGTAIVAEVPDGRTLVLADERGVRLAGLGAVEDGTRPPTSFAASAKGALAKLALGHTVRLRLPERPIDRYGRVVAQVFDERGT